MAPFASQSFMVQLENALYGAPRTRQFSLLISSDEEGHVEDTIVESPEIESSLKDVSPTLDKSNVDNDEHSEDWTCAKPKSYHPKKPTFSPRNPQRRQTFGKSGSSDQGQSNNVEGSFYRKAPIIPLSLDMLNPEQTLEIYGFPEIWRTTDIKKALSPFEGQYKLKWQNDTSCFLHFQSAELAGAALEQLKLEDASLRRFSPENLAPVTSKPDLANMNAENTIELFSLPSTWRSTEELNKLLLEFKGKYRVKWRNDNSCFIVFDQSETMKRASDTLSPSCPGKIRPYSFNPNYNNLVQ